MNTTSKSSYGSTEATRPLLLTRVSQLLETTDRAHRNFPPTTLFNETWMLRLVVDWYARNRPEGGLLTPAPEARWYSEALLPSRFLRGAVNEGYTNADAVIGHFDLVGERGDIALRDGAAQFVVVEAKMGSPLSAGTKNAPTFNQAARNVACMINMIDPQGTNPSTPIDSRFVVIAPENRLDRRMRELLTSSALISAISDRAAIRSDAHRDADQAWARDAVNGRLSSGKVVAECRSWESVLDEIASHDTGGAEELSRFYRSCLEHNRVKG